MWAFPSAHAPSLAASQEPQQLLPPQPAAQANKLQLRQGRCGRHLPPVKSAVGAALVCPLLDVSIGAGSGTCSSHPRESWQTEQQQEFFLGRMAGLIFLVVSYPFGMGVESCYPRGAADGTPAREGRFVRLGILKPAADLRGLGRAWSDCCQVGAFTRRHRSLPFRKMQ